MVKALRVLLALLLLALAGSAAVRGAEPGASGIASMWGGPGAATHDCIWPWTDCAPRAVQSLDTGLVIVVTPQMYCDCFVGRVGPQGETERLIDLDPSMVAALGLDPAAGLFNVRVTLVDDSTGMPDTATGERSPGLTVVALLVLGVGLLAGLITRALLEWNHRRWDRRFRGSQVETILAWLE